MKKLIIELRRHGDEEDTRHLVFSQFPVSIGRALDNDLILNDPYVSPHHLQIECDDNGFLAYDKDSDNGFTVNRLPQTGRRVSLLSGDVLHIGHTELRVYTPDHAVAETLPLQKDHPLVGPLFEWVSRPLSVWICFILAMAVTVGWAWLEIWSEEEGLALAGAAAGSVIVIIIWAAIWSVGGKLAHRKASFKGHVALICLYMIAGTLAWYMEVYTDFLTNENWLAQIASYGINFVLLAMLLYGSFALATQMPLRKRATSAVFFSFGVMAGIFLFTLVSAKTFNQQPLYPATLEPFLSNLAPADTVDQFVAGNEKLFSSDAFTPPVMTAAKAPAKR